MNHDQAINRQINRPNKKKLGSVIIKPCEDPEHPGQIYKGTFGRTEHAGVNFINQDGRFQRGWIPLDLWLLLPEESG